MKDNSINLQIIDYDRQNLSITNEAIREECLDPIKPFGDGLVICYMLKVISPWRDIWLKTY